MKKLVSALIFSLFFYNSFAQLRGIIYYKKTVDDKQTSTARTENYAVYFASGKSLEIFLVAEVKPSSVQTGENSYLQTVSFKGVAREVFVYKDPEKNVMTLADNIGFKTHLVKDTLATIKWTISNEKMRILKYSCTKATANFRGRNYTAWFTEQVPVPYGPWKFGGLPGLIVKVSNDENMYTYELEGLDLKTDFDVNIINVPQAFKNDTPITHSAFIDLYRKKVTELETQSRASAFVSGNVSGSSKRTIPPKMEKF